MAALSRDGRQTGGGCRAGKDGVSAASSSRASGTWPALSARPSAARRDTAPAAGVLARRFVNVREYYASSLGIRLGGMNPQGSLNAPAAHSLGRLPASAAVSPDSRTGSDE